MQKMAISERRRAERGTQETVGTIRERARSSCAATFTAISSFGCRAQSHSLLLKGNKLWVGLPGLGNIVGRIVWSRDSVAGVAFETLLHPAVAARFKHDRDAAADADMRQPDLQPEHSDQEPSSLPARKNSKATGMLGLISRMSERRTNHRGEERFDGSMLPKPVLYGKEAAIENISASGIRVRTDLFAAIGDIIMVEFDGFAPIAGQLIWMKQGEMGQRSMGLSLPPDSIELYCD